MTVPMAPFTHLFAYNRVTPIRNGPIGDAMDIRKITKGNRLVFVLVVASFMLSTLFSLISIHALGQKSMRESNTAIATRIYDHIMIELSEPVTTTKTMSAISYVIDTLNKETSVDEAATEQSFKSYLEGIENQLGCEGSFIISETTHRYYTAHGVDRVLDPKAPDDSWYNDFLRSPQSYNLDVDNIGSDNNDFAVYVDSKIYDKDKSILGITGVTVHLTGLRDFFQSMEKEYDVKIDLVDQGGLVQVDTDSSRIEKVTLHHLLPSGNDNEYVYRDTGNGEFAVTKHLDYLGWYLVIQSTSTNYTGHLANIIIANIFLCAIVLVIMVLAMRHSNNRATALATASLIDSATGLHNRRAYEEDRARLEESPTADDFVSMTADVNGLKTTNDTLGHEAGDELIRGAATCLQACLGQYGKVYRTGGDEFAALLNVPGIEQKNLFGEVSRTIESWRGEKIKSLSISCGFASKREFPTEDVAELCRFSDKRMYADKQRYYDRMGFTQRMT